MARQQACIVAALIRNPAGEILVSRRHNPNIPETHGIWEFIGGGVEWGEDPEQALLREVKEESGLDVAIIGLLPKIFHDQLRDLHAVIITYECEILGNQKPIPSDPEVAELRFAKPEEVLNYKAFDNVIDTIKFIKKNPSLLPS